MRIVIILLIVISLYPQNYLSRKDTVETITDNHTFFINRNDSILQTKFDYLKSYLTTEGFGHITGYEDAINDSLTNATLIQFNNGATLRNGLTNRFIIKEDTVVVDGFLKCYSNLYTDKSVSNTFLGVGIAPVITSGIYNTFTGNTAGTRITTGSYNSIYGSEAGLYLTTGQFNNLFGTWSGRNMTTGTYNNIYGNEAGYRITTGSHNTIMGHHAMLGTSGDAGTATNNTLIGANSGYKINTGSANACLGMRSMGAGSGSNNTMLGAYTGYGTGIGNIGNNNVFIGYQAGYYYKTASDSLEIATGYDKIILKGSGLDSTLTATGDFTVDGDLIIGGYTSSVNKHGVYAQLVVPDTTFITTANTFQPITGAFNNRILHGFTFDADHITCHTPDSTYFIIDLRGSFTAANNTRTVSLGTSINGETIETIYDGVLSSFAKIANEQYFISTSRVVKLIEGDQIQIQTTSSADGSEIRWVGFIATIQRFNLF